MSVRLRTKWFWVRVQLQSLHIHKDIAEDVETRSDTSNYEIDRPLPTGKNKNVIGFMKDESGGQIMKKIVGLIAKTYSYLKDNNDEDKRAKGTKKCAIKRNLQFRDYKKCLQASQIENKITYLEKKENDADSLKERNHKIPSGKALAGRKFGRFGSFCEKPLN